VTAPRARRRVIQIRAADTGAAVPGTARWRAAHLLDAPHRLLFFAAALLWSAIAVWWAAVMAASPLGWTLPWAVAPAPAHALLMTLGFMPLFIAGFLFTAGPTWLRLAAPSVPSARTLRWPALSIVIGWGVLLPGLHLDARLAVAGLVAVALGWSALSGRFAGLVRISRADDRLHAKGLAIATVVIVLALWLAALALALEHVTLLRVATCLALWGGLASVFALAGHRLTPFFHPSIARRFETGLLGPVLAGLWLRGAADLAALWSWPWPMPLHVLLAVVHGLLGGMLLVTAFDASLARARRAPMVRLLHAGFVWLGVSFVLESLSQAVLAAGRPTGLGLAPLHALSLGFMATTLLAMASRVAAGQHGRTIAIDRTVLLMHVLLQGVTVLRLLVALWPSAPSGLLLSASFGFAALALAWTRRHAAWFGRPRADALS